MNYKLVLMALLLSLSSGVINAKKSDREQPIKISADNAKGNQGTKNFELVGSDILVQQGTLLIHATKIVYTQESGKHSVVNAYGSPATFQQLLDTKNKKGNNQQFKAKANHITYNSKTGNVVMRGEVNLSIDQDRMSGNQVNYNTITERYTISASKKRKVSIVIYPK